jgi:RNA polymerase sigma-70 factor, ECF subfamily
MEQSQSVAPELPQSASLPDEEVARRVLDGEPALFELLMRRNNQRVYRAVRGLLRDEAEVEDVMQQAYVSAYLHLGQFEGASKFSTWLVRIAINEALARLRKARRLVPIDGGAAHGEGAVITRRSQVRSPEDQVAARELIGLLEEAVDGLPDIYREVFMLREIEGMSTAEAAQALGLTEDGVKTRLHRAKALLQGRLASLTRGQLGAAFTFEAPRCDRVVRAVMTAILRAW